MTNSKMYRTINMNKYLLEKHPEHVYSEELEHCDYWGSHQQLLSGKVICDWLCEEDVLPMDPIFGVLLNPTAGKFIHMLYTLIKWM